MATANFTMIKGLSYIYALGDEDLYAINEDDELDYDILNEELLAEIKASIKELNLSLDYHAIEILDGYYKGIQLYFKESITIDDFNMSDYDLNKDRGIAIYFMEIIALRHGFKKIKLVAQFSNGEAMYEYVK
jgi:hypothetical protein